MERRAIIDSIRKHPMRQLTPQEDKDQRERLQRFLEKELGGAPYMTILTYVLDTENKGDGMISQNFRTVKVSNTAPNKTDFLTFKGLITTLKFEIDKFVGGLFPPPVSGKPPEGGSHYG